MIYQQADKALVSAYFQSEENDGPPATRNINAEALDLPYPVWAALRAAYYDKALRWYREKRDGKEAWAPVYAERLPA